MNRQALIAILAPHAKRPIRAFLADREIAGTPTEAAFWDAVYINCPAATPVDHAEAVRVAQAMESSSLRVATQLEGWRP